MQPANLMQAVERTCSCRPPYVERRFMKSHLKAKVNFSTRFTKKLKAEARRCIHLVGNHKLELR